MVIAEIILMRTSVLGNPAHRIAGLRPHDTLTNSMTAASIAAAPGM